MIKLIIQICFETSSQCKKTNSKPFKLFSHN